MVVQVITNKLEIEVEMIISVYYSTAIQCAKNIITLSID